jgi:dephospho-CoA kinase
MATHPTQPDDSRLALVLIGPPGSGKGTQAVRLAERYNIPHISTGDILRAAVRAGSPLGRQVAETLASGGLVGDEVMTDLVRERLAHPDARQGFILDGFPRTVVQAQALDDMLEPSSPTFGAPPVAASLRASSCLIVVLVAVADEAIVRRLSRRRVCASCAITQSVSEGAVWSGATMTSRQRSAAGWRPMRRLPSRSPASTGSGRGLRLWMGYGTRMR